MAFGTGLNFLLHFEDASAFCIIASYSNDSIITIQMNQQSFDQMLLYVAFNSSSSGWCDVFCAYHKVYRLSPSNEKMIKYHFFIYKL